MKSSSTKGQCADANEEISCLDEARESLSSPECEEGEKENTGIIGVLKSGWRKVKDKAKKVTRKMKNSDIGKKTAEKVEEFKQTQFAKKVNEGAIITGEFVKEGAKRTGAAMKDGAQKVKESDFGVKVKESFEQAKSKVKKHPKHSHDDETESTVLCVNECETDRLPISRV